MFNVAYRLAVGSKERKCALSIRKKGRNRKERLASRLRATETRTHDGGLTMTDLNKERGDVLKT